MCIPTCIVLNRSYYTVILKTGKEDFFNIRGLSHPPTMGGAHIPPLPRWEGGGIFRKKAKLEGEISELGQVC